MPHITLPDGEPLYYETHGEGPPLVVVTGLNGLASFWHPHVEALGRHFTMILHDHRGTGTSSLKPIAFSVDQMAADTLALMDALGLGAADIVGHSTGGAIGQVLAIEKPERVKRLLISASWAGRDPYFDLLFETRAAILSAFGPVEYVRQTVLIGMPPTWLRDNPAKANPPAPELAQKLVRSVDCTLARIEAIRAFGRRADLARIVCPVLVAGAEDDMVTPAHLSRELADRIPGARLEMADWGGHFYPVIRPELFREQVLSFFR